MTDTPPRLGIVGPFLGGHPGWVRSQGEALADALRTAGWTVRTTSTRRRALPRALDTAATMLAWRGRVDIVVVLVFSGGGFAFADLAGVLTRAWLRRPLVAWLHGGDLPRFADRHRRWTARVLGRADTVVAPSPYLVRGLASVRPMIEVLPNAVDLGAYTFRRRDRPAPRLLWMRTFHPIYRPGVALDVLEHLLASHPDARLTLAGQDRGLRSALEQQAAARGLSDAVRFPGFLDTAAKRRALAEHDVFLNTNQVDNTPVSVIEAMASGMPVVAADVGGLGDLVRHGENGLLVPDSGDRTLAEGMAAAVRSLLGDPGLAARLGTAGRATAESSAVDTVSARWQALLKDRAGT